MKRITVGLGAVLAALLVVMPAAAQRGGGHTGGGHHGGGGGHHGGGSSPGSPGVTQVVLPPGWGMAPPTGFGNVNHPGGVIGGVITVPSVVQPFNTPVVQPLVGGSPFQVNPTVAIGPRGHRHFIDPLTGMVIPFNRIRFGGFGGIIAVPVAVPVFGGYVPQQQPTVIIIQQPAQPEPPGSGPAAGSGVYQPSTIYTYESRPPADPASTKPLTLLVFKNHSIYAATDYWVEDDRLHYVTSYGAHSSVPLDQLDQEFTVKLNEERNIKFDLKK